MLTEDSVFIHFLFGGGGSVSITPPPLQKKKGYKNDL